MTLQRKFVESIFSHQIIFISLIFFNDHQRDFQYRNLCKYYHIIDYHIKKYLIQLKWKRIFFFLHENIHEILFSKLNNIIDTLPVNNIINTLPVSKIIDTLPVNNIIDTLPVNIVIRSL